MSDFGGFRALIEEAKSIREDLRNQEITACPNDGTPLEKHPRTGMLNCPMGDFRAPGGTNRLQF